MARDDGRADLAVVSTSLAASVTPPLTRLASFTKCNIEGDLVQVLMPRRRLQFVPPSFLLFGPAAAGLLLRVRAIVAAISARRFDAIRVILQHDAQ
ncbi:MAG: hypothetical protein AB7Q81_24140 [Gammaproteobacteria bacterium]